MNVKILNIAGKFLVYRSYRTGNPFDDGRFFRIFDTIEAAVDFRRSVA